LLLELWDDGRNKKTVIFVTHDIDEAILLSDRIVVMSAGTGEVKKEIPVEFERPRNRAVLLKSTAYSELRNMLLNSLYDDLLSGTRSKMEM